MAEEKKKVSELIALAQLGREITVRDDQFPFVDFLDAARICRHRGERLRLIDTGKLSPFELEWLGEAGADIYTSDEARPKIEELELLAKACSRGKAVIAYFHHGQIEEGSAGRSSLFFLVEVGRRGVYLHLSNREIERDLEGLSKLASACRGAGVWLVYYHHGSLDKRLENLAREGAWVHLSDKSLSSKEEGLWLTKTIKECSGKKPRFVIHMEEGLPPAETLDLERTGAFLLFKTPPCDYKSASYAVERRAKRRRLDFRAYYLYTTFLP